MLNFLTDKMNIKSQSSTEFLIFAGLGFVMVIIFVILAVNEVKEFSDTKEFFLVKDLALKLQKEIFIASSVSDGYERSFDLPSKLDNFLEYSIIITNNNTITINSSISVFSVKIPSISGNFTNGTNKIEKIGGKIYANR